MPLDLLNGPHRQSAAQRPKSKRPGMKARAPDPLAEFLPERAREMAIK